MISLSWQIYLLCLSTASYVATSLVVAAVRWFHVCPKDGVSVDYLYPGRRMMTFNYVSNLVLLPLLWNPNDSEAWSWVRDYFPLCFCYSCIIQLFGYFGGVRQWNKWRRPVCLLGLPVAIVLIVYMVVAAMPGTQLSMRGGQWLHGITLGIGAVMLVCCAFAVRKVWQWIKEVEEDDFFSNTDDFPSDFARRMCLTIGVLTLVVWTMTFLNHPIVLAAMLWLFSVWAVLFLIIVLPSKRRTAYQQTVVATDIPEVEETLPEIVSEVLAAQQATEESRLDMSPQVVRRISAQVRQFVEEQKNFLNAHLTIGDVAAHCDYSRTYVSKVVKSELGGFYNYVNALRLRQFDDYMRRNPMATQETACMESGFSSRQAYYNAKKKLTLSF